MIYFKNNSFKFILSFVLIVFCCYVVEASSGSSALMVASGQVRRYVNNLSVLVRSIGGIVGIIGAIKVYNLWALGDRQYYKAFYSWAWAMLFLHLMPNVLTGLIYGNWTIGEYEPPCLNCVKEPEPSNPIIPDPTIDDPWRPIDGFPVIVEPDEP